MKSRTPKKIPTQARAKAKLDAILSTTESLLLADGPAAITTTAIAQVAGIPVGSIYQYFDDKDEILSSLYATAYAEVEDVVAAALEQLQPGQGFAATHEQLIRTFWQAARAHRSFRQLTRWANHQYSLWDVTPGPESHLAEMVTRSLAIAGVDLPEARRTVMLRTIVTTLSVLVDQAIEEQDETVAEALVMEITALLSHYID